MTCEDSQEKLSAEASQLRRATPLLSKGPQSLGATEPRLTHSLGCRQAAKTGKDSFLLGPSGYGFLHPSIIAPSDPLLSTFINGTRAAAELLSTSAYVHWDDYDNSCVTNGHMGTSGGEAPAGCRPDFDIKGAHGSGKAGIMAGCGSKGDLKSSQNHSAGCMAVDCKLGPDLDRSQDEGRAALGTGCKNELDMERYLRRLQGTNIQSVFSPILPFVPRHIGELATFRELYRWFGKESGASLAQRLGKYRRGTIGYVYMIPDVALDSVEELGRSIPEHVELVGYRELAQISKTRKAVANEGSTGTS